MTVPQTAQEVQASMRETNMVLIAEIQAAGATIDPNVITRIRFDTLLELMLPSGLIRDHYEAETEVAFNSWLEDAATEVRKTVLTTPSSTLTIPNKVDHNNG